MKMERPAGENVLQLVDGYFFVWNNIDDLPLARDMAQRVVFPKFKSRFSTKQDGPESLLEIATNRRKAFKDSCFEVDLNKVVVNDDGEIVVPYVFTGVYRGTFLSKEAQGKRVEFNGTAFYKVEDGKLLGLRSVRDEVGMLEQLGVDRPDGDTDEF